MIRFTEFGGPLYQRPVQDLAFSVARFIQKGGSYINYYMVCDLAYSLICFKKVLLCLSLNLRSQCMAFDL